MIRRSIFALLIALSTLASTRFLPQCRAASPVLTVLHTFGSGGPGDLTPAHNTNRDGTRPESPLLQGSDGALYGTAPSGGANGTGVIFKLNADGTGFNVLHSFGPLAALFGNENNADGAWPKGALVQSGDGTIYGTTSQGGPGGSGTVYKLKADGTGFVVLHAFSPKGEMYRNSDGAGADGLVLGANGTLFGAALFGGAEGRGLIFNLTQDGKVFHIVHLFRAVSHEGNINEAGAIPTAVPIIGRDGTFYGTTNVGGKYGYGVVYKLSSDGKSFTVIHHFQRKGAGFEKNGVFPQGTLTLGADSSLYGVTRQGGEADSGILYKLSVDGAAFTVLHTFSDPNSSNIDGSLPAGPLVFRNDDQLYGLTGSGGEGGAGTLFWASTDGARFSVSHHFSVLDSQMHNSEGGFTLTGLTLGHDGNVYGISSGGGQNGNGTIFRVAFPEAK